MKPPSAINHIIAQFARLWGAALLALPGLLNAADSVVSWGENSLNQTNTPAGLTNLEAVAAGEFSSMVLQAGGNCVAWGHASLAGTNVPPDATNLVALAGGGSHNLALRQDGRVIGWGANYYPNPANPTGQINPPADLTNAVGIAAGWAHSLAVRRDGRVAAWGYNAYGQTDVPPGLAGVVQVAAGAWYSVALKNDGTVVAWGDNRSGQTTVPPGLSDVVAISARGAATLALRRDGTVVAWGGNSQGQTNVPPDLTNAVAVAAGNLFELALRSDGTVIAWGDNTYGQRDSAAVLTNVTAIAAGGAHGLGLLGNGSPIFALPPRDHAAAAGDTVRLTGFATGREPLFYQWSHGGTNLPGAINPTLMLVNTQPSQAGTYTLTVSNSLGVVSASVTLRVQSSDIAGLVAYWPADGNPNDVAGGYHGTAQNVTYTAGRFGQAFSMNGSNSVIRTALDIQRSTLSNLTVSVWVKPVSSGNRRIVLSNDDGGWDRNLFMEGDMWALTTDGGWPGLWSTPFTATVNEWQHLVAVYRGTEMVVFKNGIKAIAPFPSGADGQTANRLTIGNTAGPWSEYFHGLIDEVRIYSRALSDDEVMNLYYNGQLPEVPVVVGQPQSQSVGLGTTALISATVAGTPPLFVQWWRSTGPIPNATNTTLAIVNAQIADTDDYWLVASSPSGTATSSVARVVVSRVAAWGSNLYGQTSVPEGMSEVVALAAGHFHSLALKRDGTVYSWGNNNYGQVITPPGLTNVVAIAAGARHSMALKSEGTVVVWGWNGFGQLNVPAGLNNVVAISAGGDFNLALRADGSVVHWGVNDTEQGAIPADLTNAIAIAAGSWWHGVALRADGRLTTWGRNNYGQRDVPAGLRDAVAVANGLAYSLALRSDGTVIGWGYNYDGQINIPPAATNIVALSAGGYHAAALNGEGRLVSWGYNGYGQLNAPEGLVNVTGVAAGPHHTLALVGDGVPFLNTPLLARSAGQGETVRFFASASGSWPLSYQWKLNGTNLSGATNPILVLPSVQVAQSGTVTVVVSNSFGTTSKSAVLTVRPAGPDGLIAWWKADGNALDSIGGYHGTMTNTTFLSGVSGQAFGFNGANSAIATALDIQPAHYANLTMSVWVKPTAHGWGKNWNRRQVLSADNSFDRSLSLQADQWSVFTGDNCWASSFRADLNVWQHLVVVFRGPQISLYKNGARLDCPFPAGSDGRSGNGLMIGNNPGGYDEAFAGLIDDVRVYGRALSDAEVVKLFFDAETITFENLPNPPARDSVRLLSTANNTGGGSTLQGVTFDAAFTVMGDEYVELWQNNGGLNPWFTPHSGHYAVYNANGADGLTLTTDKVLLGAWFARPDFGAGVGGATSITVRALGGAVELASMTMPLSVGQMTWLDTRSFGNLTGITGYRIHRGASGEGPYGGTHYVMDDLVFAAAQPPVFGGQSNLVTWGWGAQGQATPPGGSGDMTAVAAGEAFMLAVTTNGLVRAWGYNGQGQTIVPAGLSNVVAVSCGREHSLALRVDGTVVGWGYNGNGEAAPPASLSNAVAIAAGWYHSVALRSDGTIICWGRNANGELDYPPGLSDVVAIAAGGYHNLALRRDGTVVGWGRNANGELNQPPGLSNVVAIAAGAYHSLALKSDGTIAAWGLASEGQLNAPPDLVDAVAIAAGGWHNLALRRDGTVIAWGADWYGQATPPFGLGSVAAIAAGYNQSLAFKWSGAPRVAVPVTQRRVPLGGSTLLAAQTTSRHPVSYQWRRIGLDVPGATNTTLLLTEVNSTKTGDYVLVASNEFGIATSPPVSVSLLPTTTTAFTADFQGAVNPAWSATNTTTTPWGNRRILGLFTNQTVALTLTNLPTHNAVSLSFDLMLAYSWDGNNPTSGPDRWTVQVSNGPVLLDTTFSNVGSERQDYPSAIGEGSFPAWTGAVETNTLGYGVSGEHTDSVYRLNLDFAHDAPNLTLLFKFAPGGSYTPPNDDAWGLDNVRVDVKAASGGVIAFAPPVVNVFRDATNAVLTVRRLGGSTGAASLSYATQPGTATLGSDYVHRTGSLTFAPGQTEATLSVPLLPGVTNREVESFYVNLSAISGFVVAGANTRAQINLLELPTVEFARTNYLVSEGFGSATVQLARSGALNRAFAVELQAQSLTAQEGTDFTPVHETLSFAINDTAWGHSILVHDNPEFTGDRSFRLSLSAPDGARLGSRSNAVVTLLENDTEAGPGLAANGTVRALMVQPDGKLLVGGAFRHLLGQPRERLARLNADGSLDAGFPVTGPGNLSILALALQPDGNLVVGGNFLLFNGLARPSLARVLTNGAVDTNFNALVSGPVFAVAVQPSDGKIVVGGLFAAIGESSRSYIARLNTNGSLDTTFGNPTMNSVVRAVAIQSNLFVLCGGDFTSVSGTNRARLARLNADGTLDTSFPASGTGANGPVYVIQVLSSGKILIGGNFTTYNGVARNRIAQLNADGTLDTSFNPGSGANGVVYSLAEQANGCFLVAGSFNSFNGLERRGIARLLPMGALDGTFAPLRGANGIAYAVAALPDGRVALGGDFLIVNGRYQPRISLLSSNAWLPPQPVTWTQWRASDGGNDHWYALTTNAVTWQQARSEANTWIGNLASVGSAAEQRFLENTFLRGESLLRPFWIGLNDAYTEGTFAWANGEAVTYTFWSPGEPNNSGDEDYVAMNWAFADSGGNESVAVGSWNDLVSAGNPGTNPGFGPYFGIMESASTYNPAAVTLLAVPQSRNVPAGNSVGFGVIAAGAGPFTYQWQFNGTNLSSATAQSLTLPVVTLAHAGSYTVLVTNRVGAWTSSPPAMLVVEAAPVITLAPTNQMVIPGDSVTLAAAATGTPPMAWQWYQNGVPRPGATDDTLLITDTQVTGAGDYVAVVTNQFGAATSAPPATLTVLGPPYIIAQPQSRTNAVGSTAMFSVSATGIPPLIYRWQFNGSDLTGATNASLEIPNVQPANAGFYTVAISNAVGFITSASANLTVLSPPVIVIPPSSQTNLGGTAVSLSVLASGSPPLSYQWNKDGSPVVGAVAPVLSFGSVQPADAGAYTVIVSNLVGVVTSVPPAILKVITFAARHGSLPAYQSPGPFTLNCQITHAVDRTLFFIVWQPELPPGWVLESVSGAGNPQISGSQVVFSGALPNPLSFACTVQVPADEREPRAIRGGALYFLSGMTGTAFEPATPDPLTVNYGALLFLSSFGSNTATLTFLGDAGSAYSLETSTSLESWSDIGTYVAPAGALQTNAPATNSMRFFRARKH